MKVVIQGSICAITITDLFVTWKNHFISVSHITMGERIGDGYILHLSSGDKIEFSFNSAIGATRFSEAVIVVISNYNKNKESK